MKKSAIVASVAIAAAALTSCGGSAPKPNVKSDIDSLSYAVGMAQTQGLKEYMVYRMGVDTTYMDAFIKGIADGANAGDDKRKAAYYAGLQIGQQVALQLMPAVTIQAFGSDSTRQLSMRNFLAGFASGITGDNALMTVEQAGLFAQTKMEQLHSESMEKIYGSNRQKGEEFLAENAKKDSVQVLPSGVQYKIIKQGNGPLPTDSSRVEVHYEGRTLEGKVFDSSYKRNRPAKMRCNQTIQGWTDAMVNMPVGSIWEVYIPQELAYGSRESGDIKPFSALIFKIELLGIEDETASKKK